MNAIEGDSSVDFIGGDLIGAEGAWFIEDVTHGIDALTACDFPSSLEGSNAMKERGRVIFFIRKDPPKLRRIA